MPVTAQMIGAVMDAGARAFPQAVVTCSYAYTDSASAVQSWGGPGVATELRGAAQYDPSGQWIQDGLSVTVKVADLPPVWPKPGDIMDIRRGDAEAVAYVVKNAQPMLQTLLNLTLEKRFK